MGWFSWLLANIRSLFSSSCRQQLPMTPQQEEVRERIRLRFEKNPKLVEKIRQRLNEKVEDCG